MSARRRRQSRDRLGRFSARRGLPARARRAGRRALAATVAALRGELARRLGRLVVAAAAMAAAVVALYQHGEEPAALARPAATTVAPAPAVTTTAPAQRTPAPGRAADGPATTAAPRAAATRPSAVAAAWYAARGHLPPGKVRALQQDAVSQREVRVLVMADRGDGRLDTALVTVRRDAAGRWSVP
jgi:hypothetical protein